MAKYLFIFFFFLYFNCNAQSYLGKTRKEITELAKDHFEDAKFTFNSNSEATYIKIVHDYETLYYYLENDVCVKFVVYKPFSCKCLHTDIMAYETNLISYGELMWISPDYTKIYEMELFGEDYSLTIVPVHEQSLTSN